MLISLIAAMSSNRVIGDKGTIPWKIPGEQKMFKEITLGHSVIMGRKTFESIGRALPGRQNIVVTRSQEFTADGCDIAGSLQAAIDLATGDEVRVIGGGQLYLQVLPMAVRLIITHVDCAPEADTWFPEWDISQWREVRRGEFPAD